MTAGLQHERPLYWDLWWTNDRGHCYASAVDTESGQNVFPRADMLH